MIGNKLHSVKNHLEQQYNNCHAIGLFNEYLIDSDHVAGNRKFWKYISLCSASIKSTSISKKQAMNNQPAVLAVKQEVIPSKKIRRMTGVEASRINYWRQEVYEGLRYIMLMHLNKTHKNYISMIFGVSAQMYNMRPNMI